MNEANNSNSPEKTGPAAAAQGADGAGAAKDREDVAAALDLAAVEAGFPAGGAAPVGDTGDGADAADAEQPDELELAYGEVADLKDKLLRALAETENIRRRSEREKSELRKYAIADFARDMLAVSDNLQRALTAVGEEARKDSPELAQLLEGVDLTQRELRGLFDKHGIKEINPLGEKLDPNLHQAVVQIDDAEAAHGTVVQVMQPGYVIHDRLLRAAMVGVAKGPAASPPAAEAAPDAPAPDGGHGVDTKA